jgi:lipoprotein-releasing system permease protein
LFFFEARRKKAKSKAIKYFRAEKTGNLSFENFISGKLLKSELQNKKVSRPIVRISVTSIALAIVVNLITLAVVKGFQNEISNKVSGFGAHIRIMSGGENSLYDSNPIHRDQHFLKELTHTNQLSSISPVAYKPVLFQSANKKQVFKKEAHDTLFKQQEICGAVLKGVDCLYDLSFFKKNLVSGRLPQFNETRVSNELLLSEQVVKDLHLTLNDNVRAFFVKNQPVKREFKLVGIYRTGLEEFDRKIAIGDIRFVQALNDWGISARILVSDTLSNGQLIIRTQVSGGNGNFKYDWGNGYEPYNGFTFCPTKDTIIRVIVSDFYGDMLATNEQQSIPDTAYLQIHISGQQDATCSYKVYQDGTIRKQFRDMTGDRFSIDAGKKTLHFLSIPGNGSSKHYVGGFELTVKNWNSLDEMTERLKRKIAFLPNEHNETLSVSSIKENQPDIFVWLGFLDINVMIIISLMLLIGIINMGAALLVMILVRSNFIGIMKAMGASDWSIRKIFLHQATWLILRGIAIGNIVGIVLCLLQHHFRIIRLDPAVYYLDSVPVEINWWHILLLNVGTLVVCVMALIIPSVVITRIEPAKSIRFN